jgi:hypothetical protein
VLWVDDFESGPILADTASNPKPIDSESQGVLGVARLE